MTSAPSSRAPFVCRICQRPQEPDRFIFGDGRIQPKPPLCRSCEEPTTYSWNGRPHRYGVIKAGSFGDRRAARRLFAIADALEGEARRQIHGWF